MANRTGAKLVRIEDAFLRSLYPGRSGEPPLGLMIDHSGCYYDARQPSDLETLLKTHPLDDAYLLMRARDGLDRLRAAHLSKYAAIDPGLSVPASDYVLVIDQTRGDASIRFGGADATRFRDMLAAARREHPQARILIKTHPETRNGYRPGHFGPGDLDDRTGMLTDPVSPWTLMDGAIAVYTVTSGFGFEAILAGRRPCVFGQPFYAGWGLSEDRFPITRRQRELTRAQLFAGALLLAPTWFNPYSGQVGAFEEALGWLEANVFTWRADRRGYVATGMRLWKRRSLQNAFGRYRRLRFVGAKRAVTLAQRMDRPLLSWAGKTTPALVHQAHAAGVKLYRVEDGFLRSRGLGAALIPALSLVTDLSGIYYDPSGPSDLETLIARRAKLSDSEKRRASDVQQKILRARLNKYNLLAEAPPELPEGRRILVPGQVADDASILTGTDQVRTNRDLLQAARDSNPGAVILYKPHPDVEAGLRTGKVDAHDLADLVLTHTDPAAVLEQVDEVWTMTSLLGFEALLRGKAVTCLGMPFYAGWGLTRDFGPTPARRAIQVPLEGLIHAALIDYPRYFDPVTQAPCPVEIAIDRLAQGNLPVPGYFNRLTAKLQGFLASHSWLWR